MIAEQLNNSLISGIKKFFSSAGKKKAVLGLSGGIDSALCAVLLAKALGPKNVTAILMPLQGLSSKKNLSDAKGLAKKLKINHVTVQIKPFVKPFSSLPWKATRMAKANAMARIRAVILYSYANSKNALVCGTGNKTEFLLGYFTKHGDAAADFFPIGSLLKSQVRELAAFNHLPQYFITKPPTAELWIGQTDEKELGVQYETADGILELLLLTQGKKKTKAQIIKAGYPKKAVEKVISLLAKNKHKREPAPIIKPG